VTASFLTLFGFIFVITQYFQFIKNYTAFQSGVRLLPVAISIALASILGPRLVQWVGTTAVAAGGLAVFAAGLAWASTADAATPYSQIATQMLLLGGGLGLTIAPATEAIMGSLDADKAGIGSAVNDTTREFGGTLGVAIVGSVFASVYSSGISSAASLARLPADVHAAMGRSMEVAHSVIAQLPAERVPPVRDAVNGAFLDGLQVGSLVCAAIALGAAVVVAFLLPARGSTNALEINITGKERQLNS
jgi:Na+/melibiose symporter-like transporter